MPAYLNKELIISEDYHALPNLSVPEQEQLNYPEKVIQFGSGALLRGFIDFFIDQANRKGVFDGKAVVVNNTQSGRSALLNEQEGLFTLCIEGFAKGKIKKEYIITSAISRALPAAGQWPEILACAKNENIQVVVSNTTEIGITLQEDDNLRGNPPASFPGKLTAFLYERYKALGGTPESGMVILPTELIPDNGRKLKEIVLKLAEIHQLEEDFKTWIREHNIFCNTLVDRIVPGEPDEEKQKKIEDEIGYHDALLTISEVYRLFAIEGDQNILIRKVPFLQADEGIIIAEDITPYRERKLRILNGGHTISVAAGFLSGLETVYDCMEDAVMSAFITQVIHDEIVPSLDIDQAMAKEFAGDVLDRFRNPFLHHKLISITLQYTSKMNMRNGLTFVRYYQKFGKVPALMCAGFAAYLLFTRAVKKENEQYYGSFQGKAYPIHDEHAAYFYQLWQQTDPHDEQALRQLVDQVLSHKQLWEQDLNNLGDFSHKVKEILMRYIRNGVKETLAQLLKPSA